MDELPKSARDLIALARAAEQPPEGAEERVRTAVAIAIGVGVGTAAATVASPASASSAVGAAKAGWFASSAVKLAVVGGVVATLGTTAVVLQSRSTPAARPAAPMMQPQHPSAAAAHPQTRPVQSQPVPAPQVEPVEAPQPSAADPNEPTLGTPRMPAAHAHRSSNAAEPAPASSLHEEMTLLYEASAALDRGDLRTAHRLLGSHVQRYAHGQLVPERLGLQVLEACVAHQPSAEKGARAYLRVSPDSVLATRVAGACKLEIEQ